MMAMSFMSERFYADSDPDGEALDVVKTFALRTHLANIILTVSPAIRQLSMVSSGLATNRKHSDK